MMRTSARPLVGLMVVVSMLLLAPGILYPALTIRGVLTREGIAQAAPMMLERGLTDETMKVLQSMMNPTMLAFLQATGGDVRAMLLDQIGPRMTAALQQNVSEIQVYEQTRSIAGAVQRLYEVGSPVPATLILLFSVVVPIGKAALVVWAVFLAGTTWRARTLHFVTVVAKWSMADVFVVALFITFLAAQASTASAANPEEGAPLIAFTAALGPGFYWFTAYCLFSLASQQVTLRLATAAAPDVVRGGATRGAET